MEKAIKKNQGINLIKRRDRYQIKCETKIYDMGFFLKSNSAVYGANYMYFLNFNKFRLSLIEFVIFYPKKKH